MADDNVPEISGGLPYKVTPGGKGQVSNIAITPGATLSEESSKSILQGMQQLEAEMKSPYRNFRSELDTMLAHTGVNPSQRILADTEKREQEQNNLYNLALQKAQVQAGLENSRELSKAFTPGETGANATGNVNPIEAAIAALPDSEKAYGRYLAKTNLPELMKKVQAYELKKPDQLKGLDALKGMDYTPQNEAWARQNYPELFAVKKRVNTEGVEEAYNPDPASLFRSKTPVTGTPTTGTPVQGGLSTIMKNAGIPDNVIISQDRDPTKQLSLIDRPDPNKPGAYLTKEGNPVALPNQSTHQLPDMAKDLKSGFVPTAVQRQALKDAGAVETHPGHWELPAGKNGAPAAVIKTAPAETAIAQAPSPAAPVGTIPSPVATDTSTKGVDLRYENRRESHKIFSDKVYAPLAEAVKANENAVQSADAVLEAIPAAIRNPATPIEQAYIGTKMATGLPVSPEETAAYMSNLTIDQAQKQFVALGAKAAMGSQYTGKESDNFQKTLAGISNPNEFIKTTYQIIKAKALIDLAHEKYLRQYPDDKLTGQANWENSGERERIFKANVDAFKNASKVKETPKKDEGTSNRPSWVPADAKIGTDAQGKPGWFVTRGEKTFQVTQ